MHCFSDDSEPERTGKKGRKRGGSEDSDDGMPSLNLDAIKLKPDSDESGDSSDEDTGRRRYDVYCFLSLQGLLLLTCIIEETSDICLP